jgi:hypothetical protein
MIFVHWVFDENPRAFSAFDVHSLRWTLVVLGFVIFVGWKRTR